MLGSYFKGNSELQATRCLWWMGGLCHGVAGVSRKWFHVPFIINSQLRTGADKGNPTV